MLTLRVLESQNQREAMINQAEAEKTAAILRAEGIFFRSFLIKVKYC